MKSLLILLVLFGCTLSQKSLDQQAEASTDLLDMVNEEVADAPIKKCKGKSLMEYRGSINQALVGYDIVQGEPMPLVSQTTSGSDPGLRQPIFEWMPERELQINDKGLYVQFASSCQQKEKSTIIKTMKQLNEKRKTTYEVEASADINVVGVGVGMEFSASGTNAKMQETLVNEEAAVSIWTRQCSVVKFQINNEYQGMPKFAPPFKNFVERRLLTVPRADREKAFGELLKLYGTHYLSEVMMGSRLIISSKFSKKAKMSKSEKELENCANAKVSVSYAGSGAKVSAGGCGSKSKSDWESDDSFLQETVTTSFGTFKTDKSTFTAADVATPLPVYVKLRPLVDLFRKEPLRAGGIKDPEGSETKLKWLKNYFKDLKKYYCKSPAAKNMEAGTCGAARKHGCGYDDTCALSDGCVTKNSKGEYECIIIKQFFIIIGEKCSWKGGDKVSGTLFKIGEQEGFECVKACRQRSVKQGSKVNGVRMKANGKGGCWCVQGLIQGKSSSDSTYKTCVFEGKQSKNCERYNVRYEGSQLSGTLSTFTAMSWQLCAHVCKNVGGCVGWTWYAVKSGSKTDTYATSKQLTCNLWKSGVGYDDEKVAQGAVSGKKGCPKEDQFKPTYVGDYCWKVCKSRQTCTGLCGNGGFCCAKDEGKCPHDLLSVITSSPGSYRCVKYVPKTKVGPSYKYTGTSDYCKSCKGLGSCPYTCGGLGGFCCFSTAYTTSTNYCTKKMTTAVKAASSSSVLDLLKCVKVEEIAEGPPCMFTDGDGIGVSETSGGSSLTGDECALACINKRKTDKTINGVTIRKNGKPGCWCERGMKSKKPHSSYRSCFLPSECITTSGPTAGQPCIFPFKYGKKTCTGPKCCNLDDSSTGAWCSTKVDADGVHVSGNYAYCKGTACAP